MFLIFCIEYFKQVRINIFCLYLFQEFFDEGECIIREGAMGDTFFIINKGEVA